MPVSCRYCPHQELERLQARQERNYSNRLAVRANQATIPPLDSGPPTGLSDPEFIAEYDKLRAVSRV